MIRRPPRSTLFPTRRSSDLFEVNATLKGLIGHALTLPGHCLRCLANVTLRSEEHTSELQSRGHLVCRLLHEKKKTSHTRITIRTLYANNHENAHTRQYV